MTTSPQTTAETVVAETAGTATTNNFRPVSNGEVIGYAKKSCRTCFGKGSYVVRASPEAQPRTEVCGCTLKNFLKNNATRVVHDNETAQWFWLPEAP